MNHFHQKISTKIRMRARKGAETGNLIIQVIIDSNPIKIPTGISWPANMFDMKEEKLLPRFDDDKECYQHNMILLNEKAKANKLALKYYAADRTISPQQFKSAFTTYSSSEDVIETFRKMGQQLFEEALVDKGTLKNYNTHFNRMEEYFKKAPRWKFNTISQIEIQKLDNWIRDKFSHNTVAGAMRVFKKFFSICHKQGMLMVNPMLEYKMPAFAEGIRDVLEPNELKALTEFYYSEFMTDLERDCLRRYLISCYTGLRKSDIEQLDPRFHIRNRNVLRLNMFKTRKYGKSVEFNLSEKASKLIGTKRELLFPAMESALLGKTLRRVIMRAGIDKYVKFHSGRDTFATIYLELGGNVVDLQEILGHADLKTTMIYVKMTSRTKNNIMNKFDAL